MRNPQKLRIGLCGNSQALEQILIQEGLEYVHCTLNKIPNPRDFSLLLISGRLSAKEKKNALSYCSSGGSLISEISSNIPNSLSPEPEFIKFIMSTMQEPLFAGVGRLWIDSYGFTSPKARIGAINGKKPALVSERIGKGFHIAVPFDISSTFSDFRSAERGFCGAHGAASEEVCATSKGNVRKLLINCIRHLLAQRNLPYIHKWYYPFPYSNIFSFRIDWDFWDYNAAKTAVDLGKKHKIPITWFINFEFMEKLSREEQKKCLSLIKQIPRSTNQKVHSHGYKHDIYDSEQSNYSNLQKAHSSLKSLSISPNAFVAPFGKWNPSLQKALERMHYSYSSDFCWAYDDLPSRPLINNKPSSVLQIPVHPNCIYRLKTLDYTSEQMKQYYAQLIEQKLLTHEPIILYDHPVMGIEKHPEVIDSIFARINSMKASSNLWIAGMDDFCNFWIKREKMQICSSITGNKLAITASSSFPKSGIEIITPDGMRLLLPAKPKLAINLKKHGGFAMHPKAPAIHDTEEAPSRIKLRKRALHFAVMKCKRALRQ